MSYSIMRLILAYLTIGLVNALFTIIVMAFVSNYKKGFLDLAEQCGYESRYFTLDNLEDLDEIWHTDAAYVAFKLVKDTLLWPTDIVEFIKVRLNKSKIVKKKGS